MILKSDNIVDQKQRRPLDPSAAPHVVHLTSSRFFGGPERQMLGLAEALRPNWTTRFISFSETGLCRSLLNEARRAGFEAVELEHDTPRLLAAFRDLSRQLTMDRPDILLCHGYKANLLGLLARRRLDIPVVSVSRGWTGESRRVRLYEALDRVFLRHMDHVVCVAEAQAEKVRRAGVPAERISVIHNAIAPERFSEPDPAARDELEALFPEPPRFIVGAAGRLSPEKGYDVLIDAATHVVEHSPDVGFVLFGDGDLRETLADRIDSLGLGNRFILAGFRSDLDHFMPHFDLFVQSSHTEGLPNVLLEAAAVGVPVVATDVGGTAEVVADGRTGALVPPADAMALADCVHRLLEDTSLTNKMKAAAPAHVAGQFTFARQADEYRTVFRHCDAKHTNSLELRAT